MALTDKLSAIGAAIREKTGKTELLTLDQMPIEIASITTGGGSEDCNGLHLPEEALVITGDCTNKFSYNGWNWFVELYGDKITTQNLGNGHYMFYYSDELTSIPFALNFNLNTTTTLISLFENCYELTELPKIVGKTIGLDHMFTGCSKLRVIPEDYFADVDFTPIKNDTSSYGNKIGGNLFNYCYSLRSTPLDFLANENQAIDGYYYAMYYSLFYNCRNLDEIVSLPVNYRDKGITSNFFNETFSYCYRLKNMTFAVQEDGTPYTAKWKSQVINLSVGVGYGSNISNTSGICGYNSGITADKEVKDDATYQALKDNPDWFTLNVAYSRYNHDSAVATINSLPDTSAYGTNTIKFKGASGELTDGGAINTLTEEEIAVATAKGWTVTFV